MKNVNGLPDTLHSDISVFSSELSSSIVEALSLTADQGLMRYAKEHHINIDPKED